MTDPLVDVSAGRQPIVGVVPAAGHAHRLPGLAVSKEVLPVAGRPVMDYVLERMRLGGADEIRVVTRPEKTDVAARARELGASVVAGTPASVAASLRLGLRGVPAQAIVLVGFPDTVWEPEEGYAQLVDALRAGGADVVLGVFGCTEPERSDVVELDAGGRVRAVVVKPARPSGRLVWGCAAARAGALEALAGEEEAGHAFDALARAGRVLGVHLSDEWLDIGTPDALERAAALGGAA